LQGIIIRLELNLSSLNVDIVMDIEVLPINMKLENKGITLRYCTDAIMPPILCQTLIRLSICAWEYKLTSVSMCVKLVATGVAKEIPVYFL
jgi:hypothetical protein